VAVIAFGLALVLLAQVVKAGGTDIPTRKASLCESLGYPTIPCTLRYQHGTGFWGILEITVDEFVHEPDTVPYASGVTATTIRISRGGSPDIVQTYQVNTIDGPYSGEYELLNFLMGLWLPPCVFLECVERREVGGATPYNGVTEEDLADVVGVTNKIVFQRPDSLITMQLQLEHGATGTPVAVYSHAPAATVSTHVMDNLATSYRIPIAVRFACAYPPVGCVL
jgi:hypothetical protein